MKTPTCINHLKNFKTGAQTIKQHSREKKYRSLTRKNRANITIRILKNNSNIQCSKLQKAISVACDPLCNDNDLRVEKEFDRADMKGDYSQAAAGLI